VTGTQKKQADGLSNRKLQNTGIVFGPVKIMGSILILLEHAHMHTHGHTNSLFLSPPPHSLGVYESNTELVTEIVKN
jgi:hypothetical protein